MPTFARFRQIIYPFVSKKKPVLKTSRFYGSHAANKGCRRFFGLKTLTVSTVAVTFCAAKYYFSVHQLYARSDAQTPLQDSNTVITADASKKPWHNCNTPMKQIRNKGAVIDTRITLYQYTTCPFCCKVRAYLDFYGLDYDIIEVNSITQEQMKWSEYKKVPFVVLDKSGSSGHMQVCDSSVIISALHSHLITGKTTPMDTMLTYYPCIEYLDDGKKKWDFPNKYFIMYGEKTPEKDLAEIKEEREWRAWVDDNLVHVLSPNAYRTLSEAVESFRWFSVAGEWDNCMSSWSKNVCIYAGALVMWVIGGRLRRRYGLDKDVRKSLYKSINDWLEGIGPSRTFMGGNKPNLADLAVYGVLSSIEGCQAFKDLCNNTKLLIWYEPAKEAIEGHMGADAYRKQSATASA